LTLRVHVMGASGSGATTIGRRLAEAVAAPHFDTDDFYWRPTDPPFIEKRPIPERRALMREVFAPGPRWVLSGSLDGWGDPFVPLFDRVVFVSTPDAVRLPRLRQREALRLGGDPDAERAMEQFLDWAAQYETGGASVRSRARHEIWLAGIPCPVIRVDGAGELGAICAGILAALPEAPTHASDIGVLADWRGS